MHANPTLMGSSKVFRYAHWGGPGGRGERETISGMCGEDLCCLCALLFSNTTPLVSKPTASLYPWNNPGLGMVFLRFHMNRLPVTSEGLCDKNKGKVIYYTWTHSLTAPHLKPLADTHICVNQHSLMTRPSLRRFSIGHRDSFRL